MNLIGPHEGIEFDLLNSGEKNVALFYEVLPEQIEEFKKRPDFCVLEFLVFFTVNDKNHEIPYVILFRKGFESAAHELKGLVELVGISWSASKERRVGQILGYPKEAVEYFISTKYDSIHN